METSIIPPPHNFPLLLTGEEMKHPLSIFREYFSGNTLPETRQALQELQYHALSSPLANGKDTVALINDMLRLAEAGWLLCRLPARETEAAGVIHQHNQQLQ